MPRLFRFWSPRKSAISGLKARVESQIPDKPLIEGNVVLHKHRPHLLLKIPLFVMGYARRVIRNLSPALAVLPLLCAVPSHAQPPHQLRIRIINAKTSKPVPDEHLNVALRADQIGSVAMATDRNGIILVDTGNATTIRILSNMYADCRPRAELYTDYSIDTIRHTGITTGNLCGGHANPAHPGELVLFEVPKTYIPGFGEPPASNLPHSDENPHSPPKPQ
jgi:hypothetical protein